MITTENLAILRKIKLTAVHFAYDRIQDRAIIEPRLRAFKEATGYGRRKVSVYILTNFDTTLEDDIHRIQFCRELDFQPYPMIYDKEHCAPVYRRLQRWCNPVIFWRVCDFEEYTTKVVI